MVWKNARGPDCMDKKFRVVRPRVYSPRSSERQTLRVGASQACENCSTEAQYIVP